MMIRVMYWNGKHDMVKTTSLDRLIDADQVLMFERSDGWAIVGKDRTRSKCPAPYEGPERRGPLLH